MITSEGAGVQRITRPEEIPDYIRVSKSILESMEKQDARNMLKGH